MRAAAARGRSPRKTFRLLNNPVWHPSGRYVAGRKHFTTRRSLGTGEIWLYSLDGGEGVMLVKRPSEEFQKELGEPAFSPDGKYLYYSQNVTPGPIFEYAQDTNRAVFAIKRHELATGETNDAVNQPGGAARPTPSPDGRWLAYVHRVRTPNAFETTLFVKDLVSGRGAAALRRPRPRHAGDVGRQRRLSEHGLAAGQQEHRVLGRRRHQAHRRRFRRGERHPVSRQGHAHDAGPAAPRHRGRAG